MMHHLLPHGGAALIHLALSSVSWHMGTTQAVPSPSPGQTPPVGLVSLDIINGALDTNTIKPSLLDIGEKSTDKKWCLNPSTDSHGLLLADIQLGVTIDALLHQTEQHEPVKVEQVPYTIKDGKFGLAKKTDQGEITPQTVSCKDTPVASSSWYSALQFEELVEDDSHGISWYLAVDKQSQGVAEEYKVGQKYLVRYKSVEAGELKLFGCQTDAGGSSSKALELFVAHKSLKKLPGHVVCYEVDIWFTVVETGEVIIPKKWNVGKGHD